LLSAGLKVEADVVTVTGELGMLRLIARYGDIPVPMFARITQDAIPLTGTLADVLQKHGNHENAYSSEETLLLNRKTRFQLLNDIEELEGFLCQRLVELESLDAPRELG
jgi:hypothetical protein